MPVPVLPQLIAWLPVAAFCHSYLLYPATLRLWPRRFPLPSSWAEQPWPTVALLIPAYNEAAVIQRKVANALALDYDPDKLEIWVGSDGSSDETVRRARALADPRVHVVALPGRNGKTEVINRLAGETAAEILVITDANARLSPDSLRFLVRHFANPAVGAASGAKHVDVPPEAGGLWGETYYSNFENRVKTRESEVGGLSGCRGALMAVRHRDFQPYPAGTVNDDLVLALVTVLSGRRVVFEPRARAAEESALGMAEEFRRRVRIGGGNFQALARYPGILHPRHPVVAYTFISHKVLRWLLPPLLLLGLLANLLLLRLPLYRVLLTVELTALLLALAGWGLVRLRHPVSGLSACYHFAVMNLALLCGFARFLRGGTSSAWERTARERS